MTNVRLDPNRRSRFAPDGTVEDRCDRCGMFRRRTLFVSGAPAVCRPCRDAHRPTIVGPLAPTGGVPDTNRPAALAVAACHVAPSDHRLARGRYSGARLADVPLAYLRSCAYGKGSAISTRAHILWGGEVRMIRLYLQQLERQGS